MGETNKVKKRKKYIIRVSCIAYILINCFYVKKDTKKEKYSYFCLVAIICVIF